MVLFYHVVNEQGFTTRILLFHGEPPPVLAGFRRVVIGENYVVDEEVYKPCSAGS